MRRETPIGPIGSRTNELISSDCTFSKQEDYSGNTALQRYLNLTDVIDRFYVPPDTKIRNFGDVLPSQFLGSVLKI